MKQPKLLFIQYRYDRKLPPFLLIHKQEHVAALSHFFDVVVVDHDANYQSLCDRHEPDVAMFESGVNHPSCRRPRISGVKRDSSIPKIGLHHADAFCNARAGFMSDMASLGIDTCFAIATTAGEHTPQLCEHLFYWPVFFDPRVFRDHGQVKRTNVLLTGNQSETYPWRRGVFPALAATFGNEALAHPGYFPKKRFERLLVGLAYARALNAAHFVPACGTVARELVRKHLEVPAVGSCLVAERTPALEAAGFVDGENCLFADSSDAVDKVEHLLAHPDALARLTANGHRLVHGRHTDRHRRQIRAWFDAQTARRPGERIVQSSPFEMPARVPATPLQRTVHLQGNGAHLQALQRGNAALTEGNHIAAARQYRQCLAFIHWMPEPKIGLARCCLLAGDPGGAEKWLDQSLTFILDTCRADTPDPVEWALVIVIALCRGDRTAAARRARAYPDCHGPELERARWLVDIAMRRADAPAAERCLPSHSGRGSLHEIDHRSLDQWRAEMQRMLRACHQFELANALLAALPGAEATDGHPVDVAPSDATVKVRVSAVIPTFNRADVLLRAVDSVLAQTCPPTEIIIVDDGSTDSTREVLRPYGERIRYIFTPNRGVAAARDRAVLAARGGWIAFLDSDDYWAPDHLDAMTRGIVATHASAAWYFGDATVRPDGDSFWQRCGFLPGQPDPLIDSRATWAFRAKQPVLLQASVISRQAILDVGGFAPHLRSREDTLLFFRISLSAAVCAVDVRSTTLGDESDNRLTTVLGPQSEAYLRCTLTLYGQVLAAARRHSVAAHRTVASRRLRASCVALVALQSRRLRFVDATDTLLEGLSQGGLRLFGTVAIRAMRAFSRGPLSFFSPRRATAGGAPLSEAKRP